MDEETDCGGGGGGGFIYRDCPEKNETDIFFYIPKMVASRVKSQARDQND